MNDETPTTGWVKKMFRKNPDFRDKIFLPVLIRDSLLRFHMDHARAGCGKNCDENIHVEHIMDIN